MELLSILSWISYTVPYDNVPGRLAPLVTILLAMINTVMRAVGESPDKNHYTPLMLYCGFHQIQVNSYKNNYHKKCFAKTFLIQTVESVFLFPPNHRYSYNFSTLVIYRVNHGKDGRVILL